MKRPKIPTQPPMKRKPTVRSRSGCATITAQMSATYSKTEVPTVPRSVSRVAIVLVMIPPF